MLSLRADTVILSAGDDGSGTIEISGEVVDYTGANITVQRAGGVERDYPAARVERVETRWPERYEAGAAALDGGDYPRAAELLAAAAQADRRAWVRRLAMEKLMRCYAAAGDPSTAGRLLVELAKSDPATPALDHAPLAWYTTDRVPPATVDAWLANDTSPAARLMGASYALQGSGRATAIGVLEHLARSSDERIAQLATVQRWRAEIVTAKQSDVARWEQHLRDLPEPLQTGGWFVLGEAYKQQRSFDSAAIAFLRCHLLADRQPQLAAQALWEASRSLATAGQQEEADNLARQLIAEGGQPEMVAVRFFLCDFATLRLCVSFLGGWHDDFAGID